MRSIVTSYLKVVGMRSLATIDQYGLISEGDLVNKWIVAIFTDAGVAVAAKIKVTVLQLLI
ncbi:hypothetical protein NWP22_15525 [Anabaenopsis tanganyikae CS-531]|uniref:Uncharacterized protein n=2 Tax=Anabaenopsis TaxID=110103 RepID=A0ABT6KH77_9CYAN|nr:MULTISPECIES: hypothetical protein [Anabaenopsis]MDB9541048.1 hypothetical protein [Anabaenopsis arnoldii]MDH6093486.1 hypothetical protein [Anabaenopsis arnoldii]MDH6107254.1 hypothetical protein [Anabaenopsis tanganyikae CS-531]